jgi:hypothetical protein
VADYFINISGSLGGGGGGGGVTTVGTFSGTSETNGAAISSSTITFGPADASNPGMIKASGSQTLNATLTTAQNLTVGASKDLYFGPGSSGGNIGESGGGSGTNNPNNVWINGQFIPFQYNASAPPYSFFGSLQSGMHGGSGGYVGFASNGTTYLEVEAPPAALAPVVSVINGADLIMENDGQGHFGYYSGGSTFYRPGSIYAKALLQSGDATNNTASALLFGSLNVTPVQTTLTGSAGTALCSQPLQGSGYKKVVIYLSGYTDTGTQTFTFPIAFSHTPYSYGLTAGVAGATVTTTTITFTVTTQTGFVFLEGY